MIRVRSGLTLVEVMVVATIIALLAAIALPNLRRAKILANDAFAKTTLGAIAKACENYAIANNSRYPADISALTSANPVYLFRNDCDGAVHNGYIFNCNMGIGGYTIVAAPLQPGLSGTEEFTMTTGGVLSCNTLCQ